jgi:hypothetical protein
MEGCAGEQNGSSSIDTSRDAAAHLACPPSDATFTPSNDPRAATMLVPGRPGGVLVCRYWGRDDTGRQWTFAGERYVPAGAKLARFVRKLNGLPPIPTAPPLSCPSLGGRSVLLLFRYRDVRDDPVRILREGCISVSNGHLRHRSGVSLLDIGEHWADEGAL